LKQVLSGTRDQHFAQTCHLQQFVTIQFSVIIHSLLNNTTKINPIQVFLGAYETNVWLTPNVKNYEAET
jgi:hypothetical protein